MKAKYLEDPKKGSESDVEKELCEGLFILEMEERLEMVQALENDVVTSCCDDF